MRPYRMAATACLLLAAPVILESFTAPAPENSATVALSPSPDGHDTVPAQVNGKGPFPFILDTGADGSAVYQWFVDRQHLPKLEGKDQLLSGQTGTSSVSTYRLDSVTLAGVQVRNIEAFALPDRRDKGREAGVIGNDFMDHAIVAFDFPCRTIALFPRSTPTPMIAGRDAHAVAMGIDKDTTLLTLPVTINGVQGIAILDTGSRRTRITTSFAKAAGIDPFAPAFHADKPIYGTSLHPLIPRTGPVGRVSFAGETIDHAVAQVVDLPVLAQDFDGKPAMLLGADLLDRYRLIYDHAGRRIWLRPSRCG
ncbi:hypothetical protein GCM10023219_21660 [Stakelama sediminis]|uniref:Putative aspartyl protease n=1 Tax=Stakelama sediminis TaxID=463200 RepID=A0A840Z067_9SPHN|nr:retroviral-like aspartic protease family protein [Stakelama sediminis]MBB5719122.1 putative aspartyl protease [Stakelama sediminis]